MNNTVNRCAAVFRGAEEEIVNTGKLLGVLVSRYDPSISSVEDDEDGQALMDRWLNLVDLGQKTRVNLKALADALSTIGAELDACTEFSESELSELDKIEILTLKSGIERVQMEVDVAVRESFHLPESPECLLRETLSDMEGAWRTVFKDQWEELTSFSRKIRGTLENPAVSGANRMPNARQFAQLLEAFGEGLGPFERMLRIMSERALQYLEAEDVFFPAIGALKDEVERSRRDIDGCSTSLALLARKTALQVDEDR